MADSPFTSEINDALASIDRHVSAIRERAAWLAVRDVQVHVDIADPQARYGDTQKVPLHLLGFRATALQQFHPPKPEKKEAK